jgi:hypothetical protein
MNVGLLLILPGPSGRGVVQVKVMKVRRLADQLGRFLAVL